MPKKKFSAKQLAAQRLFAKRARAGTLRRGSKKRKSKTKTRRSRGGAASDITKESKSLLLLIKDPNIKEIVIKKN